MAETLAEILFHLEEMGSDLRMTPIKRQITIDSSIKTITDYKLPTSTARLWKKEQYKLLRLLEIEIEHKDILHSKLNQYLDSFERASRVEYSDLKKPINNIQHISYDKWFFSDSDEYSERMECLDFYKRKFFNLLSSKIENTTQKGYAFYSRFKEDYMKEKVKYVLGMIVLEDDLNKIDRLLDSFTGFERIVNTKHANPIMNSFIIPIALWKKIKNDKIRIKLPVGEAFKVLVSLERSGVFEPVKGIITEFYSELFLYRDFYSEEYESLNPNNIYTYRSRGKDVDDIFLRQYGLHNLCGGSL